MSLNRNIEIDDDVRTEVSSADLDLKEMEYCVLSPQVELRLIVANNPSLTPQFIKWMSSDIEHTVRATIARNLNLDPSSALLLATDPHIAVVSAAAENPNLAASKLAELSNHRSYIVRTEVAKNKSTPLTNLEKLSKDTEWGVRCGVGANAASSKELLKNLSSDQISEVRVAVAGNANTEMSVLEELWDNAPATRSSIIENPACSEIFLNSIYQNALLPEKDQDETWDDDIRGDTNTRSAIAQRADLSIEFLKLLVVDPSHYVRRNLAENKILTDEFLSQLALDSNEGVREAVVNNPQASAESKATATLLGLPAKEDFDE
jgi:hypothetical protein